MDFREPVREDLEAINILLEASFSRIYAWFAKKSFSNLQNSIIAEVEGGRIIAAINYRILEQDSTKIGYLYYLAVQDEYRRRGIGRELGLRAISSIEKEYGPLDIFAAVEKKNTPSREMLKSLGFKPLSRAGIKKKFGAGQPAIKREMNLMPWEDLFVLTPPLAGN
ncbi:MAG: GNAT family N-acetyltransferase [Brevinematales bacterium]|jgi:ribosomal protein S18 acetylase RimI-like enzyme